MNVILKSLCFALMSSTGTLEGRICMAAYVWFAIVSWLDYDFSGA
jgi:hypothetical protein